MRESEGKGIMVNFGKTQDTLLSLLGHNLFSVPYECDAEVDWLEVVKESRMQSVMLIAFKNYKELPLDEQLSKKLEGRLFHNAMSNARCFNDHTYLHSLLESGGIPYCILKGAASAHYYSDALIRAMGDVDFYVPPEQLERATEVLLSAGFERMDINHKYHRIFKKDKIHCEMHFEPIGLPEGNMSDVFWDYWRSICDGSVIIKNDLVECRIPSPFLHGFILLSHFVSHLLSEGIGLRHVCDFAVFADHFSNEEFTDVFADKLKRVGLWRLAQLICLGAVDYMGMPYREWMGDDHETAKELLTDILKGGNFGKKDSQRAYEGFFISDGETNGKKSNRITQAFKSLNGVVDIYWKHAKKFPLLYPVGWIYFSLRFVFRCITGKRKVSVVGAYTESEKRQKLYEKLNISKPEK